MGDVPLVVAMAAITFSSRAVFLVRPGAEPGGLVGKFLEYFPLALFVSLAASTMLVPESDIEPFRGIAGFGGAIVGAVVTKRSLGGVLLFGGGAYWLVRALGG